MFKVFFSSSLLLSVLIGGSSVQAGGLATLGEWLFKGVAKSAEHNVPRSIERGAIESSEHSLSQGAGVGVRETVERDSNEAHGMHLPHPHPHSSDSDCDRQHNDNC
jgi:hypothetical protein